MPLFVLPDLSVDIGDDQPPYGFAYHQADEFAVRHGIASLFRKAEAGFYSEVQRFEA